MKENLTKNDETRHKNQKPSKHQYSVLAKYINNLNAQQRSLLSNVKVPNQCTSQGKTNGPKKKSNVEITYVKYHDKIVTKMPADISENFSFCQNLPLVKNDQKQAQFGKLEKWKKRESVPVRKEQYLPVIGSQFIHQTNSKNILLVKSKGPIVPLLLHSKMN